MKEEIFKKSDSLDSRIEKLKEFSDNTDSRLEKLEKLSGTMNSELKKIDNGIVGIIWVGIIILIIIFIIIGTNHSRVKNTIEYISERLDNHCVFYRQFEELEYRVSDLEDGW